MKRIRIFLLLLAASAIITACSTQKKRGEVSGLGKFYHNTTAKFNGWFNANELVKESVIKLNDQHEDNYNKFLNVYKYVAAENPKAVAEDLDEAIKKVSVVISIHRVSDWTDDCYFIIGKSQYLKKDYESAEETFQYMMAEYSPEAMAKREKEGKKRKKGKKKKRSTKKKKKKARKKKDAERKAKEKERKKANKELKKQRKKKRNSKKKKKKNSSKKPKKKTKEKPQVETPKTKKKKTKDDDKKKKKQEEEEKTDDKPDKPFLKRPPAYQEARLWLARTYIERDNFEKADKILKELESDPKTLKDVRRQLAPAQAYFYMARKSYEQAITPLEKAIELANKRQDKARYAFILAQIHQHLGRGDVAYEWFDKSRKYSRDYSMAFRARLMMAQNGWLNGKATADQTIKDLKKMLKDIKNEEFKDQIYYALAQIALQTGDKKDAIAYLKQSLQMGRSNQTQKVETYYQLAELYYGDFDFVNAKLYYDSTLQVMTVLDDRYTNVSRFSKNLGDIAANLIVIQEQDSLLAISRLSEEDKEKLAYKLKRDQDEARIAAARAQANKAAGSKTNRGRPGTTGRGRLTSGGAAAPSTFFAYDERAKKKNRKDFNKRWGSRTLEDNWRRWNRQGGGDIIDGESADVVPDGAITDDDVKSILKGVPSTPAEIKVAEDKIADAMFVLGSLYRDRLEMNDRAIEMLEDLEKRFPGHRNELDSWYYLYITHKDEGNNDRAKFYYDKIIQKYPETTYAQILVDPNFLDKSKAEERRLTIYYDETYDHFKQGKYELTSERIKKAEDLFGKGNALQARFSLLQAMCIGNLQGKDAYKKALEDIVATYPDTPEQKKAREIIRLLGGRSITADDRDKLGGETLAEAEESPYTYEPKKLHYFIVVLDGNSIKLTDAKADVSDFNRQYYKLDKLRISNVYLGTDTSTPILVIRRFRSSEKAMDYLNTIEKNRADFLPEDASFEIYPISQYNYRQILKNKSLSGYPAFFEANYR